MQTAPKPPGGKARLRKPRGFIFFGPKDAAALTFFAARSPTFVASREEETRGGKALSRNKTFLHELIRKTACAARELASCPKWLCRAAATAGRTPAVGSVWVLTAAWSCRRAAAWRRADGVGRSSGSRLQSRVQPSSRSPVSPWKLPMEPGSAAPQLCVPLVPSSCKAGAPCKQPPLLLGQACSGI